MITALHTARSEPQGHFDDCEKLSEATATMHVTRPILFHSSLVRTLPNLSIIS